MAAFFESFGGLGLAFLGMIVNALRPAGKEDEA